MTAVLNEHSRRWQLAALAILVEARDGRYERGPWVPVGELVKRIREEGHARAQAASGALRALRFVGLADVRETQEGTFWKATEAAQRAVELLEVERATSLAEKLADVVERVTARLNDESLEPQTRILRARMEIAALATQTEPDRAKSINESSLGDES